MPFLAVDNIFKEFLYYLSHHDIEEYSFAREITLL